jgi:hypothetical protein
MAKVDIIKRGKDTWLRTLEDIHFDLAGIEYTIPAGFECDGASIPRAFWRIIGPPIDYEYVDEAIIHDWIYRFQPVERYAADRDFFNRLNKPGMKIRRYLIYISVVLFGWISWNRNKRFSK